MSISVRFSKEYENIIKKYAEIKGLSVSELLRKSVMERIEDEIDLRLYKEAMDEFENNPVTYTLDEVERKLENDEL